jgi:electron transport complex protein RnfB
MIQDPYERLAHALDRLPNGFPRTQSGVEIAILKKIFSPIEADLAGQLSGNYESLPQIAERMGLTVEESREQLVGLAKGGLIWFQRGQEQLEFRLAPFIVGIYEAQKEAMDHELAHLFENYMAEGGATGIMKPQPALHRVIPAQKAVKSEWILPYDDVRKILLSAKSFDLSDCICRIQQEHLEHRKCDFPVKACFSFSSREPSSGANSLSLEEALAMLDHFEEMGLVHTVSNVAEGVGYVCNCCGCCCGILRGITDFGIQESVAQANYYATIDPEACLDCGICRERCQVHAIVSAGGSSVVDRQRCIGCGLCVTGCPNHAAELQPKPEEEVVHPPTSFTDWEQRRLRNRGLIE